MCTSIKVERLRTFLHIMYLATMLKDNVAQFADGRIFW